MSKLTKSRKTWFFLNSLLFDLIQIYDTNLSKYLLIFLFFGNITLLFVDIALHLILRLENCDMFIFLLGSIWVHDDVAYFYILLYSLRIFCDHLIHSFSLLVPGFNSWRTLTSPCVHLFVIRFSYQRNKWPKLHNKNNHGFGP